MLFKAKTVRNKDIRVFSRDIANFNDGFKDLQEFIKERYQINPPYLIQYQDDEDDYITIGSGEDLEEAYRHSQESDKVLKLFIVPQEIGISACSSNSEFDKDGTIEYKDTEGNHKQENGEDEETTTSSGSSDNEESNEEPCSVFRQLLKSLRENEEFCEEFVNFATTFVVSVQENVNNAVNEAFNQSLSAHETVKEHPAMAKFGELLTKFPFVVGLLSSIDPDQIGEYIKMAIQFASFRGFPPPHVMHALPPWMHMMVGTMFAGGAPYGPPPPPPPSFDMHPPPPPFGMHPPHHHGPFFKHGPHGFGHARHHHGHHGHHHRDHGKCGKDNKFKQDVPPNGNDKLNGPFPYEPFQHPPPPHCGFGGYKRCGGFWRRLAKQNQASSEYDGEIIRSNLTLEDNGYVLSEQVAVKTWLVKNTGKVDWPEGVKISYVGNPFNPIIDGVEFPVQSLKVGEEAEVNVVIKAPKEAGIYRSRWRLCLSNGLKFGECLKCHITVVDDGEQKIDEEIKGNEKKQKQKKKNKKGKKAGKGEKLLKHRAKLEAKLSKVVNKIEAKLSKQKIKAEKQARKARVLDKIDEEDQQLPIPVDPSDNVNEEKKIEELKDDESLSKEIIEDEDMEIDANEIPQDFKPDENIPALVSNLDVPALVSNLDVPELPPFEYQDELTSLLDMGFEDTEKVKALLEKHKGNVQNVIANLFQ